MLNFTCPAQRSLSSQPSTQIYVSAGALNVTVQASVPAPVIDAGRGSTLSNAAAPMTMLTVDVALKVLGAVQASGLGAPAPAVHGPVLSAYAQVNAA